MSYDTWSMWVAERIQQDNYVGKHRGTSETRSTGAWWPIAPKHATEARYMEATEAVASAS